MKDRYVAKRMRNLLFMLFSMLLVTAAICIAHSSFVDEMAGLFLLDVVFFVLFVFLLEHDRAKRMFSGNRETDFFKLMMGFLGSSAILLACSFLPEFLKPVLLIPILMTALGTKETALCVGIFMDAVLCLALGSSAQELVLYCLLTLFGCMIADAMENRSYRFWHELILFSLSVMLPGLFYYLAYREVKTSLFFYGGLVGLLVDFFVLACYRRLVDMKKAELPDTLADILEERSKMARELANFSKAEYRHAKRVSAAAARCAELIDADKGVCAAAGFYYRIGILDGEPLAESGVRIAQRECFPEDVIRIISEYNGESALPSTRESAIVHMTDGLIKKLEVLGEQATSSEWNQDMVIYQTLNDFSAKGLYDESGLSMNMFLKIREYLVKEEALL